MILALVILAGLTWWWLSKSRSSNLSALGALVSRWPTHRLAAWAALAAAGFLLLHGNLLFAALLGLGAVWTLEGDGLARRAGRAIGAFTARTGPGRRRRTGMIEVLVRPDGTVTDGRVVAGAGAGAQLDGMTPAALADLLALCRARDPEGAALLETYLDRRTPGWRVDAERDTDPRPGGAPLPGTMTQQEAYEVLGLQRGASAEEIRTAHRALMKRAHPDQGGSAEGAARVNAARDRLLDRHR